MIKDVLLKWGRPQLETLYAVRIGNLQLEALKIKLNIRALKRKIEMVNAAVNTGLVHDFIEIELSVSQLLAHAELEIMAQTADIENAKKFLLS